MKLRAIRLENVRRFTTPVTVTGIADGLNVLSEPNERGKSTLFDALQALFFKAHGSRDKEVAALRPHAGGAPEIAVEVETEAGRFTIAKRWFSKPAATVHRDGRLIAQSDAAEAWIAELLGGAEGGPSGLIWVRQGVTDLGSGSKREQEAALEARRDLMSSIGEEVEAMTGGRRMDMALARCREELERYASGKTRRPRGPWKEAQDAVAALEAEHTRLSATATALHEALAMRKRCRRELAELEDPEAQQNRQDRLEAARAAQRAAERHLEELESDARRLEAAQLALATARDRRDRLRAATAEAAEAARLAEEMAAASEAAQREQAARQADKDSADARFDAAQQALKSAEEDRRRAERARAAREGAARRKELAARIAEAERARHAMEEAAAAAQRGPDAAALRRLEALVSARAAAQAARDASVPQIVAQYAPGRDGAIRLPDGPLPSGTPQPLPRATRLALDGIGWLDIRPGATAHDDDSLAQAERALREALDALQADTPEQARRAAEARAEAERRHGAAAAVWRSLAPEGIAALRKALADIPEPESAEAAPDPAVAEAALRAAQDAAALAQAQRDRAAERLSDARSEATRAVTALTSLRDRLARARSALAAQGETDDTALTEAVTRADAAVRAAETLHAEKRRAAPDLASTEAALQRAQSVEDRARAEIARLKPLLATLDERIARSAGEAVEERLAECAEALAAARAALARIEHEVAVLIRLEAALDTARAEARERYFTPVATELKPLLRLLWPEAELTWGQDTLLPDRLIRDGAAEPIDILSGGTQEQLALLVRLAFARMLAAAGRPAPVILDDALVFTDDDRIERMFDALHRQAADLQIIVLTCRQRAFRDLGGTALRLHTEG
ncbi:chromosome segregation protein SMC [Salipiger sp. P9]|uniref:AAA family ATPase n=1 Tax=Salipiger pentaromativorans TaxID=2943193 RepID=UPI0021587898|nr:chromosome segregation protein SMC [Salipiger pentaromativorans]MCR8550179.1 chromosome segregation protein SMC [Salipiger pentaromativorans]